MKRWFITCFLSVLFINIYSQNVKVYEFNSICQQAYKNIIQLKINTGKDLIEKAKTQNPDNLIPIFLESYIDVLEQFFNEDESVLKKKKKELNDRISTLKDGPENSPFYNFCLSNCYLHKSIIEIKFGETTNSAFSARKAYLTIKENTKKHPTFTPNKMLLGTLQAVAGTTPSGYKWIANILGMKGNVSEGIQTLTSFNNSTDAWAKFFNNESELIYCYLKFYIENQKDETLKHIIDKKLDITNNHMLAYMTSHLAINNKQTDYAFNIINNRNKSTDYLQTTMWEMQLGFIRLHKLELKPAIQHFENYLQTFKGNFYVKNIYQKLSWAYYLQGNMEACKKARANILTKGKADSEPDKQALQEAKQGNFWNTILLKSRLLNDGGYNKEALQNLNNKTIESFDKIEEKLEFVYRLGRIYDDLKNNAEAIKYYNKAIELGKERTEYYAARAALQIAMIYEKLGNTVDALTYYNKVLDMDDHDYKNSLDQKAKSGIARIKCE